MSRGVIDLGLERVKKALKALGEPQLRLKVIHVAGTNGKGSTCAFISSALESQYKVGKFVSPHLLSVTDSVTVNGIPISAEEFAMLKEEVLATQGSSEEKDRITNFETLVIVAYLYFDRQAIDFAVIEVGMGGRFDATNVVPHPLVCVITAIGLDHQNVLGSTLTEIAGHKCGIIKPGVPVVTSPQAEDVMKVVEETAKEQGSPVIYSKPSSFSDKVSDYLFGLIMARKATPSLQLENSAVALDVILQLREKGVQISDDQIREGFAATTWPGRCEWKEVKGLGKVLLDGAHNHAGTLALRQYIDKIKDDGQKKILWIMGATKGKDLHSMLRNLISDGDIIFSVPFSTPDNMPWISCIPPGEFQKQAKSLPDILLDRIVSQPFDSLKEALLGLKERNLDGYLVVIAGSLYLVSEFYKLGKLDI